ncbi:MAG: tetratricopeptide repeat protein [Candidatus Eisenbacteria bacterium]|uniref:Tetratricopeptide repeat protein n=1 Tax=Eiseniibacteriota bacterium TaxID=2212470 RepID=A0A538T2M9_UNCEI|nr:MAG: tetratricopeptide repeat protein [Candidatus Eisenbacteria bacterium]
MRKVLGARALAFVLAILPAAPAWGSAPAPIQPSGPSAPVPRPAPPREAAKGKGLYHTLLGNLSIRAPQDTVGGGEYDEARRLFEAGLFDSAAAEFQQFAARFPRNLFLNDAIEHVLLIRENREPGDEALRLYARTVALRGAGLVDSAASVARAGLSRFPNARVRYHWHYLLAETARERGDHAAAIRYALVIADSTSKSRLAPYALKLAGDESIAMGEDPAKALRLYQALLERYPTSPLAPPVRAQVLEIRKRLQL